MVVSLDNTVLASLLPKSTTQGFPLGSEDRVMTATLWLVILLLISFACGYAFHAQQSKR